MPGDVAEVFKKHISTYLRKRTNKSFYLQHVTRTFVKSHLLPLKTNKEIDLDKISAWLLKDSSDIIAPSLQALINIIIREAGFPIIGNQQKL